MSPLAFGMVLLFLSENYNYLITVYELHIAKHKSSEYPTFGSMSFQNFLSLMAILLDFLHFALHPEFQKVFMCIIY